MDIKNVPVIVKTETLRLSVSMHRTDRASLEAGKEGTRPLSELDRQAKELGVWSPGFQAMSRKARRGLVKAAFKARKKAAA